MSKSCKTLNDWLALWARAALVEVDLAGDHQDNPALTNILIKLLAGAVPIEGVGE